MTLAIVTSFAAFAGITAIWLTARAGMTDSIAAIGWTTVILMLNTIFLTLDKIYIAVEYLAFHKK